MLKIAGCRASTITHREFNICKGCYLFWDHPVFKKNAVKSMSLFDIPILAWMIFVHGPNTRMRYDVVHLL